MAKIDKTPSSLQPPSLDPPFAETTREDRRLRGDRLAISFPVVATHRGMPIQGFVEAINLSWSGMLLATNFPIYVNDQLTLEFTLPGSMLPITTQAKVIHLSEGTIPEEATLIGVAFIEIDPNVQRMLSGFVLEHLPHL